jgi:hypothetical protein
LARAIRPARLVGAAREGFAERGQVVPVKGPGQSLGRLARHKPLPVGLPDVPKKALGVEAKLGGAVAEVRVAPGAECPPMKTKGAAPVFALERK